MKNERRLIDANEVDPRSLAFLIHADGSEFSPYERGYNDAVISCYGLLTNAPTVDAAEVVRCKDCENWQEHGVFHICERLSWIDLPGLCKDILFDTNPDSYCSFGRRINRPKEETEEQT